MSNCPHCGNELKKPQSQDGALKLMQNLYKVEYRIDEGHRGGYMVFDAEGEGYELTGEFDTLKEAVYHIWERLGYPEEYA